MCGIFGVVTTRTYDLDRVLHANNARGRDAWGVLLQSPKLPGGEIITRHNGNYADHRGSPIIVESGTAIGNLRAEPTTEYVREKRESDVQPYGYQNYAVVHNGTIANDKELRQKYGLPNPPTIIDSWVIAPTMHFAGGLYAATKELIGSYAILATDTKRPGRVYFAMNYRPLYKHVPNKYTIVLSSVPLSSDDVLLPPYSHGFIEIENSVLAAYPRIEIHQGALYKQEADVHPELPAPRRALVVCSAGLDSTVAAAALIRQGYTVALLHYSYGARATGPERLAIHAIAERLDVPLHIIDTPIFKDVIKGSRLTETKSEIAEGEAGAEYAHEWVPARNLIMVSIALGCAESWGFDVLALGANLEEAGAYPDNEPEFLRQFEKLIPFAVSDGTRIQIETPVGNLMKHEIVALGVKVNAPMELTWSCYNALDYGAPSTGSPLRRYKHCGKCGPCYMRKRAFEINGLVDPVFAEE